MFYSQFILAKKGPLGTIWIAAHLERKLRKNQVADTDIGVSVDSILFPEVPIALRLSSHLLLGVVRIYSRKVNYLFHDCSEALLKIKQAFRSTAVDLPPEESTAPYHSITLPETFHLDDFELPDSAIQGDFVDHHVSTKEQITLQDTMDRTGYSTLQFGLDERFGDGNASHIGLDLDEDLFLEDNHPSSQHASSIVAPYECAMHQGQSSSSVHLTQMDIDDDKNVLVKDIGFDASKELSELSNPHASHIHPSMMYVKKNDVSSQWQGYNIQTPDLNEVFSPNDCMEGPSAAPSQTFIGSTADVVPTPDLAECAHAPPTPGLMEEMLLGNIHEGPALSPQEKPSPSIGEEAIKPENSYLHFGHLNLVTNSGVIHGVTVVPDSANIMQVVSSPTSELSEQRERTTATDETQMECGQKSSSDLWNRLVCSEAKDLTVVERVQDNGEAPEAAQIEGFASSSASQEAFNSKVPLDKSQVDTEVMLATSKSSTENLLVCGMTSAINNNSCGVEFQPSSFCSIEHVEDVNPCLNGDASVLSPDLHLRSCTSQVNQANVLSAQDGTLAQNVSGVLVEEPGVPSHTPVQENKLHVSESSFEVQGKDSHMANSIVAELEVQENPHDVLTESALDDSHTNELLADLSQKDTQRNQLNCSSSTEFPEPEKMLLAPTGDVDQANELSQVTEEKGVVESDGSVNRITSLSGKKRHLMETTSALQNGSSGKMSGRSRFRRNTEYVPDDDDLLASILVGKRTPLLRIGPTPPPKVTSLKRPRLAPRLCMLKRKVLLDDTTVLHADAIRQQLMNTEDIRRMRKKAPCTRPEIWMIQKSTLEDEIFNETIITGISAKLNDLHNRRYDSETNQNNSCDEPPRESDLSRNLEFLREANEIETTELISITPENGDGAMQGPSRVSLTTEAMAIDSTADEISPNNTNNAATFPERNDDIRTHPVQQLVNDMVQTRDDTSVMNDKAQHFNENASAMDSAFVDGDSKGRMVDDPTMHVEDTHASSDASIMDGSMRPLDATTLNDPQDICVVTKGVNGEALVSELDNISRESEEGLATDSSTIISKGNMSFQDVTMESGATHPFTATGNQVSDEGVLDAKVVNEDLVQQLMHNEGNLSSDLMCSERLEMVSTSPTQTITESENVPSAVGENSNFQEFNPEGGMVVESTPMDSATAKDCSDFCSTIDGNDTEFLNVDDEADYHEEGDNDAPNAEDASLENSGWSSRTRGVARYLKNLFDEESGHGRKSVAMDHLIAGKTRKEASRMFFETLVLKTKDYIHVEQENPSDYITIRPRSKLVKAEL